MSDAESVAAFSDKFIVKAAVVVDYLRNLEVIQFKKKKRTEERAKESREAKGRSYEDYDSADLCKYAANMKKLVGNNDIVYLIDFGPIRPKTH